MKKLVKILVGGLLVIVALGVAVVVFIDPNDYKPQIQEQGTQALNRNLVIEGDLSWSFLPNFGITTGKVIIENPTGFNRKNLMEVGSVGIGVSVFPLLTGNVELGELWLKDFKLNVITNKKGISNLDGIGPQGTKKPASEPTSTEPSSAPSLNSLTLAGLAITNAQIEIQDLVAGTNSLLDVKEISLGKFALGSESPLKMIIGVATPGLSGDLNLTAQLKVDNALSQIDLTEVKLASTLSGSSLPNGDMTLGMTSNVMVKLKPMAIAVKDLTFNANDVELSGHADVAMGTKTKVRYQLQGNLWNLDQFMPKKTDEETASESNKPEPEPEPNLSFLNTLDIDGSLTLVGLKASGLTIGETKVRTIVKNGVAKLSPFSAKLYQGNVLVNAQVAHDNGKNSYVIDKSITGISIQPLLKDLADTDLLAGTTNLSFKASGKGLTVSKIKQQLAGGGQFEILDGALYGVNIPAKIRSAKAFFSGESAAEEQDDKKTDFTALTGKFNIASGVVDNTVLEMAAPFVRLNGKGLANIIDSTLDYHLKATVVGTSKGQGGAAESDLAGLGIPLKITGTFNDPKFALDTSGALKAKLDQEKDKAKDKLKNKLKDKLKGKLGGLFK